MSIRCLNRDLTSDHYVNIDWEIFKEESGPDGVIRGLF